MRGGRKIVSFSHILQHDMFRVAETLERLLKIGEKEMGRPVEIEFAIDIKDSGECSFLCVADKTNSK
jgi:hypothetical protein